MPCTPPGVNELTHRRQPPKIAPEEPPKIAPEEPPEEPSEYPPEEPVEGIEEATDQVKVNEGIRSRYRRHLVEYAIGMHSYLLYQVCK